MLLYMHRADAAYALTSRAVIGYPTRVIYYPGNFLLPDTTRVPKINI